MLLRALIVSLLVHVALLLSWQFHGQANHAQGMLTSSLEGRLVRVTDSAARQRDGVAPDERETQAKAKLPSRKPHSSNDAKKTLREKLTSVTIPEKLSVTKSGADISLPHPKHTYASPSPISQSNHVESISEEALRQYRLALAHEARRFRSYPVRAREQRWEGGVTIILRLYPEQDPDVIIGKSSGYGQLDENALQTIEKASRLVTLPGALAGRAISMELSMRYELDD